jgi:hypothetical protein
VAIETIDCRLETKATMSDANLELAQRYQEKFAFYVIALTFTILGLAIQTASFDENTLSGALEIVAWFLLLISGLAGLYRIRPCTSFVLFELRSGKL